MYRKAKVYIIPIVILLVLSCNLENKGNPLYENQVGDTQFDKNIDDINFIFCDSTNVLHKRALVRYKGGNTSLEKEILTNFTFLEDYASFNGYCIVRFAVNCNDEVGRYRLETLDTNFNPIKFPVALEATILSNIKKLSGWTHPRYKETDHDGYSFLIIKITDGKITLP